MESIQVIQYTHHGQLPMARVWLGTSFVYRRRSRVSTFDVHPDASMQFSFKPQVPPKIRLSNLRGLPPRQYCLNAYGSKS